MPGPVSTRDTNSTSHVTFIDEANWQNETKYALYTQLAGIFDTVLQNNFPENTNPDLRPNANESYRLNDVEVEGADDISLLRPLAANITVQGSALTNGDGFIVAPDLLFDYFLENEVSGSENSWESLVTSYKEFIKGLVRTDIDGNDGVIVETFEYYGIVIQKYEDDDGDSSTPRSLTGVPLSVQIQRAIDEVFERGSARLGDSIVDTAEDIFKENWGPEGFDNFTSQTGISSSTILEGVESRFFSDLFGGGSITAQDLVDGWFDVSATEVTTAKGDNPFAPWTNLPNMYESFESLLGGDDDLFGDLMRVFIENEIIPSEGFFLPSVHFNDWETFLQRSDVQSDPEGVAATATSGTGTLDCPPPPVNRRRDQIINEILKLLIVILNRLEQTVVVQSQANFLNQDIQVKYTELISQVQLKDTSGIDVSDTEALENLKSDNEIVQKRLEDLRNARTTVRDAGKELTDALSATNDQIEQQSQLGSSIVQQLGELIRAIFK